MSIELEGNPPSDGGLGEDPGQPALLYGHDGDAPREALRQPGRRERLPPVLRRREGDARHRPHLLRLAGAPESRGSRSIARTSLRVAGADSLDYWKERLGEQRRARPGRSRSATDGSRSTSRIPRDSGSRSSTTAGAGARPHGTAARCRRSIRSAASARSCSACRTLEPTDAVLRRRSGMRPVREYAHPENASDTVHVYEMGRAGRRAELHVAEQRTLRAGAPGRGRRAPRRLPLGRRGLRRVGREG